MRQTRAVILGTYFAMTNPLDLTPPYKTIPVHFPSDDLLERRLTALPLSQNPAAISLARR